MRLKRYTGSLYQTRSAYGYPAAAVNVSYLARNNGNNRPKRRCGKTDRMIKMTNVDVRISLIATLFYVSCSDLGKTTHDDVRTKRCQSDNRSRFILTFLLFIGKSGICDYVQFRLVFDRDRKFKTRNVQRLD